MLTRESLGELLTRRCQGEGLTRQEVESLCERYPYFHAAQLCRAALAMGESGDSAAARSAVLVANRLAIYSLLHGAPCDYEESEETLLDVPWEQQAAEVETQRGERKDEAEHSVGEETACAVVEVAEEREPAEEAVAAEPAEEWMETVESAERGSANEEEIAVRSGAASLGECESERAVGSVESDTMRGGEAVASTSQADEVHEEKRAERQAVEQEVASTGARAEGQASAGGAAQEVPLIDLRGVLEHSLAQEVPGMSPSLAPLTPVNFELTQEDIDYINKHLNPRRAGAVEGGGGAAGVGAEQTQEQRIDSFIENIDTILSRVLEEEQSEGAESAEPRDMAESQGQMDTHIASERLAYLLAERGEYGVAIPMYERLQAKNPEKSSYFAEIIARLRQRAEEKQK